MYLISHRSEPKVAKLRIVIVGHTVHHWLLLCVLVLPFTIAGCNKGSNGQTQQLNDSWAAQISLAKQTAANIDRTARLWHVVAFPVERKSGGWQYDEDALRIQFDFSSPTGKNISVIMDDNDPSATLRIEQSINPDASLADPVLLRSDLDGSLASAQIGPRDAAKVALLDGWTETDLNNAQVTPLIGLDLGAVPAKWYVQLLATDDKPPRVLGINAQTGEIIERKPAP